MGIFTFLVILLVVGAMDGGVGKFPGGPSKKRRSGGGGGWSIS